LENRDQILGSNPILKVENLSIVFKTDTGVYPAVEGVDFEVYEGEILAIVGESGAGKSALTASFARLLPRNGKIAGGKIFFKGKDILALDEKGLRKIRGSEIAYVFQDPMTSLNPYLRISTQLIEVLRLHLGVNKSEARKTAINLLEKVHIPDAEKRIDSFPFELSGGMRQRVMIAMAIACNPKILIADEPTMALDVTIAAQILELISELNAKNKTSTVLITHDLGVVAGIAERVIVLYAGRIFEAGRIGEVFSSPANPYTKGLLQSIPNPADGRQKEPEQIPGAPPRLDEIKAGCRFAPRCQYAEEVCFQEEPKLYKISPSHSSRCHFAEKIHKSSQAA
jgi:oligopeptide/dipeptide ABC transporter ATP-binding protein